MSHFLRAAGPLSLVLAVPILMAPPSPVCSVCEIVKQWDLSVPQQGKAVHAVELEPDVYVAEVDGEGLALTVSGADADCAFSDTQSWCIFEVGDDNGVELTVLPEDPILCPDCPDIEGTLTLYRDAE